MRAPILSYTTAAAAAYGGTSRYCAPPRLLTFTLFLHRFHDYHHRHRRSSPRFSALSSFHRSGDVLFRLFSRNCPFLRMEGHLYRIAWTLYTTLIVFHGAFSTLLCDDLQHSTCSGTLNPKVVVPPHMKATWPMISSSKRLSEQYSTASGDRNKAMVENLQRYGVISLGKVAEVMQAVDRGMFVPDEVSAYVDSPMPIGYNATISAPHMHATCLQLLEKNLQPGMHALDVGSGTGYLTACFALMVGPEGRAVGVEHIPELVDASIKNIEQSTAAPLLKTGSLSVHIGDGRKGWPQYAPYDAIHVGAAAPDIPKALLDQLKPGGRMVIPVGNIFQDLKVVDKNADGSVSVHSETSVRYVPLTSRDEQLGGF